MTKTVTAPNPPAAFARRVIAVRVKPSHPRTEILGERDGAILIGIHAPAQDNKANVALLKFLRKTYGGSPRIISGHTRKEKLVELGSPA